jgi:type IV pilus assembly protein PilO
MVEMEESFGALISQLPSDTEVPGLLEDITNKGLLNGLSISSIDLQPEISREFYVELPIAIVARAPTTISVPSSAVWPACHGS